MGLGMIRILILSQWIFLKTLSYSSSLKWVKETSIGRQGQVQIEDIFFFFLIFIYLFRLLRVLVEACGIFVAACRIFSCGLRTLSCSMWTLSCGMHVGSSSLTRDWIRAPCIGSSGVLPTGPPGKSQISSLFERIPGSLLRLKSCLLWMKNWSFFYNFKFLKLHYFLGQP